MLLPRLRTLIGVGSALTILFSGVLFSSLAEAQIVRRGAGGGVQVNAPFVRVNVGRGGTSVNAPHAAVTAPGGRFFGRRRRAALLQQQQAAAAQQQAAYRQQQARQQQARQQQPRQQQAQRPTVAQPQTAAQQPEMAPTEVDLDALPYPSAEQLAGMGDQALVETLRDMMSRLERRLARLKTGDGWRRHLVLGIDVLGQPGTPVDAVEIVTLQEVTPRYDAVADNPKFAKIANLPSFIATHSALHEFLVRFAAGQPNLELRDPSGYVPPEIPTTKTPTTKSPTTNFPTTNLSTTKPETGSPANVLPTPEKVELPNATRGERSILKRK